MTQHFSCLVVASLPAAASSGRESITLLETLKRLMAVQPRTASGEQQQEEEEEEHDLLVRHAVHHATFYAML